MGVFLAEGQLLVIETEDEAFLGTAEVVGDQLVVRSGFVGRPTLVELALVQQLTLATDHADVV